MKVVANRNCIARINYNLKFLSAHFEGVVGQSFVFIYVFMFVCVYRSVCFFLFLDDLLKIGAKENAIAHSMVASAVRPTNSKHST